MSVQMFACACLYAPTGVECSLVSPITPDPYLPQWPDSALAAQLAEEPVSVQASTSNPGGKVNAQKPKTRETFITM